MERTRYHGFIASSDRWDGFALRADDIIITTPSKSGTTWMQTLVALLLFDGTPDTPVYDLSPWLDMNVRSRDEVHALLEQQTHRRFIKTHTPLDGLPWDDRVTYLTVARDPRDAFVSMLHHMANMAMEPLTARRIAAVGDADLAELVDRWPDDGDPRATANAFLELSQGDNAAEICLAHIMRHLRLAWDARHRPNAHLFHYADLLADLPAEMRRLRTVLGVDLDDERLAELAELARFDAMRARSDEVAPEASMGLWQDSSRFFRRGGSGDGAAFLTEDEMRRYDERVTELSPDAAFAAWLHHGRLATGVDVG